MKRVTGLVLLAIAAVAGCAGQRWVSDAPRPDTAAVKAPVQAPSEPEDQLVALIHRLEADGALDEQEAGQLAADLGEIPDSLRPLVAQNLRALAERRSEEEATNDAAGGPASEATKQRGAATANPLRDLLVGSPHQPATTAGGRTPHHKPVLAATNTSSAKAAENTAPRSAARRGDAPGTRPSHVLPATFVDGTGTDAATRPRPTGDTADEQDDETNAAASPGSDGSTNRVAADAWREHLDQAIAALEAESAQVGSSAAASLRTRASLRLLYLAAGRRGDAAKPIDNVEPAEQDFWKHQLHGLGVYLDADSMPVAHRRTALALREIRAAVGALAEESTLDVRNLTFCSEVRSYGTFTGFAKDEFVPDQEVLLYVEVDNFSARETPEGFVTEFQGSYQILDSAGRRVIDHTFPSVRDVCGNRRRDCFIHYRIWMPKRIYPGSYTLELTLEDTQGEKFGQATTEFRIKR